jgi:hypothetical protein
MPADRLLMDQRIQHILQDLDRVRENLLALSDDIWLSIDHNDTEAMQEGVAFKATYNEKMAAFDRLAGELSQHIQQFTQVPAEVEQPAPTQQTQESRHRVIQDLDRHEPHGMNEDFTFKRPYGFRLGDAAHADINTWRRMYELVILILRERDQARYGALPENRAFLTRRGNPGFSRDPMTLRSALELPDGIFAEANLSANSLRDQMKLLLHEFGIEEATMTIYLRQVRDADA